VTDAPRPKRRRSRLLVVGIIVAVSLLYLAVVALYAVSGRAALTGIGSASDGVGLPIRLSPQSVDPVANRIAISLELQPEGEYAGDALGLTLAKPLTILATDTDGPRAVELAAGEAVSPIEAHMMTDGDVQFWPFDTYTFDSLVVVSETVGADEVPVELDWSLDEHRLPGWTFEIRVSPLETVAPAYRLEMTAHRSGATVAFGVVLLALMVVLPVLVLTVAIAVYRGRRKLEATLMSWIGAMLFATIPLRGFLPGSPPIGSWIDYLIVLWVIAGLVVGLVIYVAAFLRWAPAATVPDRSRPPGD
jgi:hypothetical protein